MFKQSNISNIKLFVVGLILLVLSSCAFVAGKKHVDPDTGEVTYEQSALVTLTEAIGGILGVGGIAVASARIARNAVRTKNALYESNESAIENANWKEINTKESFKALLKMAQNSTDDSKLLAKEFKKWNEKRKHKNLKKKAKQAKT